MSMESMASIWPKFIALVEGSMPEREMDPNDSTQPMERDLPLSERPTREFPAVLDVLEELRDDCKTGHSALRTSATWANLPLVGYVGSIDGDPPLCLRNCHKCGSTVAKEGGK